MKKKDFRRRNNLSASSMTKMILNVSFIIIISMLFYGVTAIGQGTTKITVPTKVTGIDVNSIEGNWELVWGKYNGVVRDPGKPYQFKMFNDGYFSMTAVDSAGKFAYAGYGRYELKGNTYKETMIWHSNREVWGGSDWQECYIKGDTLYFKGFSKIIYSNGEDKTANSPKIEEKRVRAKITVEH